MKSISLFTPAKLFLGVAAASVLVLGAVFALTASAVEGAAITTTIHTSSHATTTQAAIGTMVHAEARVATTTGTTTPTGTVDFDLYSGTSCNGTATSHNDVALVNGVAESSATSVPAAGLSYRISYNGDSNNAASEGSCTALVASGPDAAITTSLSTTTARVGTAVHASASLQNVTSNASGTVAYTVYTNNACNSGAQGAGTKSVSSAVVPNSDDITFNNTGSFYWRAAYSGDSLNDAATSTCSSGVLNIIATSTPTGRIIVDKVTVPAGASTTFNFNAQGGSYGDFSLSDGSTPNEQVLTPGTYRISENSKSGWRLSSALCSRNGATSTTYAPSSVINLNGGDTVSCVFTNTQSTSTPGNGGDDDDDDNGIHNGFKCGLPYGILKKVWAGLSLPFGIEKKFQARFNANCDDNTTSSSVNSDNDDDNDDNDNDSNDDEDEDDDKDQNRGRNERGNDNSGRR